MRDCNDQLPFATSARHAATAFGAWRQWLFSSAISSRATRLRRSSTNGKWGTRKSSPRRKARWGLDKSVPERYVIYIGNLMKGDFGTSFRTKRPVFDDLKDRLPATLELVICAMIFGTLAGTLIGVVAGAMAQPPDRSWCAVDRTDRILGAGFLVRTDCALHLFGSASLAARPRAARSEIAAAALRHRPLHRRFRPCWTMGQFLRRAGASVASGYRARLGGDGDYFPNGTRQHVGCDGAGLHHHRPRQRRKPDADSIPSRATQRHGAGIDDYRIFICVSDYRRNSHRSRIFVARDRILRRVFGARALDHPGIIGVTIVGALAFLIANLATDIAYVFANPRIRLE